MPAFSADFHSGNDFKAVLAIFYCYEHVVNATDFFFFSFFFFFFLLQKFYIVFYSSYVSICKDLQKTIVLSSGPFRQVFTFTIQCICNL